MNRPNQSESESPPKGQAAGLHITFEIGGQFAWFDGIVLLNSIVQSIVILSMIILMQQS